LLTQTRTADDVTVPDLPTIDKLPGAEAEAPEDPEEENSYYEEEGSEELENADPFGGASAAIPDIALQNEEDFATEGGLEEVTEGLEGTEAVGSGSKKRARKSKNVPNCSKNSCGCGSCKKCKHHKSCFDCNYDDKKSNPCCDKAKKAAFRDSRYDNCKKCCYGTSPCYKHCYHSDSSSCSDSHSSSSSSCSSDSSSDSNYDYNYGGDCGCDGYNWDNNCHSHKNNCYDCLDNCDFRDLCEPLSDSCDDCIDFFLDSDGEGRKRRRSRSRERGGKGGSFYGCKRDRSYGKCRNIPGIDEPFFGPAFGVRGPSSDSSSSDSSSSDSDSDEGGVPRLRIEDQLRNLPGRFSRSDSLAQGGATGLGQGVLQNDVDVVRATQTTETVDVPDRYTASIGVENNWANELEADKTAYDGKKRKTFDINGKICITESCSGGICEKKFTAKDGAGKQDSENVVLVGNNGACGSGDGRGLSGGQRISVPSGGYVDSYGNVYDRCGNIIYRNHYAAAGYGCGCCDCDCDCEPCYDLPDHCGCYHDYDDYCGCDDYHDYHDCYCDDDDHYDYCDDYYDCHDDDDYYCKCYDHDDCYDDCDYDTCDDDYDKCKCKCACEDGALPGRFDRKVCGYKDHRAEGKSRSGKYKHCGRKHKHCGCDDDDDHDDWCPCD